MNAKPADLLQSLAEFFDSHLIEVKGFSQNTVTSYQYAFQLLYEYIYDTKGIPPEKATFETLSGNTIFEYLNWLETSRGCSIATRNQRLAAICSFARFAMRKSFSGALAFCSEVIDIPKKKAPKNNDIKYFTLEEISKILSLPNTSSRIGCRDAVLMSFLYASGARAQEVCDLTVTDIFFGPATKIQLVGKGNKGRTIVIPDNCARLLRGHIDGKSNFAISEDVLNRHVFSSQTNEKMSISCIAEIVKKYVIKAKHEYPLLFKRANYTSHSFRHSIAVHMLEAGESLAVIRAFLGHSSIASTLIYASVTPELANKYLRERGKPIESVKPQIKQDSVINALPFLKNIHMRSR